MDPDIVLTIMIDRAASISERYEEHDALLDEAVELAEAVLELHERMESAPGDSPFEGEPAEFSNKIRDRAKYVIDANGEDEDSMELAEACNNLFDWLDKGGFLPIQWQK